MREPAIEQLLRWRLAEAEAEAPPPPAAAQLLALAQPWWERWPHRLRARMERLRRMPLALGYAMAPGREQRRGHPVATILALAEDVSAHARILYLSIQDERLRLRFSLDIADATTAHALEATFLMDDGTSPFSGEAVRTPNGEYRMEVALPPEQARTWGALTVTDPMPFRLVLCPVSERP